MARTLSTDDIRLVAGFRSRGVRLTDRVRATLMHASARWTVRYGEELRFAGSDLPAPTKRKVPTRHGKVALLVYRDPGRLEGGWPAYVHFHGGAWLMRYPEMDDFWCRYVVAETGAVVVNVDFHVGPYAAYPVAQEECYDVVAWLAEHGDEIGVDRERIAVGGFSSGGGLAASVCLQARDSGSFRPRLQLLGVPALDLATDVGAAAGMISPQLRGLVRRVYFPVPATRTEPYASPLLAPDLSGLPSAVILTAERDSLRPDGERYAERLRAAGVPVVYDMTPNGEHYFLSSDLRRARTTMAMMAEQIAEALAP